MQTIPMTAFRLAQRYMGVRELVGSPSHPLIAWWLSLCKYGLQAADEIPWCSAFVNGVAWELDLERTLSAAARSWLLVGETVPLSAAREGFDIVVLTRGKGVQPGPNVTQAQGHVGFYAGHSEQTISVLGGNQNNEVNIMAFNRARLLAIKRLRVPA